MHVYKLSSSALALVAALSMAAPSVHAWSGGPSATLSGSVLTVSGDDADNTIVVSMGTGGRIRVNEGAIAIQGGEARRETVSLIHVLGQGGADRVVLEGLGNGLPNAHVEGGDGVDTVEVNGSSEDETFAASPDNGHVRLERTVPAPFSVDIEGTENLLLNMNGGDDTFNGGTGLATLIKLTVDGGRGADVINGSDGADVLLGGQGRDTIDGNRGDDVAFMGDGADVFIWDPGDGSDVVEGQDGRDTLRFNGANANEIIDVSANGQRARFFRNVGNINMDLDDVETIEFNAVGGTDAITVNDLSGTDVDDVDLNLAGAIGSTTGDGQVDAIVFNGTQGDDRVRIVRRDEDVAVLGLPARVSIAASEPTDTLEVNGLGGDDTFNVNLRGDEIAVTLNP